MALLKAEADKLSNNDLVRGVIEEMIYREDLLAVLPFVRTEGKAYVYNRENTIAEGDFLDPNDTISEAASTFTEVTTKLRILAGDVDVDKFIQATESDHNDQWATQVALKAKGIARKFRETLVIGDNGTNAKEFDGIEQLITAGQTVHADGAGSADAVAMTLDMLDELLDTVPNGADVIFMRPGTIRAYRTLLRASGGLEPAHVMMEDFGRPMLTHNGVPILENEFIPTETINAKTASSVYAVRLNEVDGLHGLYGGSSAGIVIEDIGTVQNKDAVRTRLKWYIGLALKSTKSLARLRGITNT